MNFVKFSCWHTKIRKYKICFMAMDSHKLSVGALFSASKQCGGHWKMPLSLSLYWKSSRALQRKKHKPDEFWPIERTYYSPCKLGQLGKVEPHSVSLSSYCLVITNQRNRDWWAMEGANRQHGSWPFLWTFPQLELDMFIKKIKSFQKEGRGAKAPLPAHGPWLGFCSYSR